MKQKLQMKKRKKTLDEQDKYEKDMLSTIKAVELQGQNLGGSSKRDNNENNNLNSLQNLSNILTGNVDSKQGGAKKSTRHTAKRFFRP